MMSDGVNLLKQRKVKEVINNFVFDTELVKGVSVR